MTTPPKPINLNRARKARAKAARKAAADENAIAFGRPKADRQRARAEADRERRAHDAHRRDQE